MVSYLYLVERTDKVLGMNMILLLFVLKVRMKQEEFILAEECFLKMICLNKASNILNRAGQIKSKLWK